VVTGASRGVGRGIAIALGAAGDTVYVTGRSLDRPTGDWPGTLADTAAEIGRRGGRGIAVACDHADDAQTKALFERIARDEGRLDLLVNNAFGMPDYAATPGPYWERPLDLWTSTIDVGLRSSYVATYYAVPMMLRQNRGLVVFTSGPGASVHLHPLPYGIGKIGHDKLAHDLAHELRPHQIASVSLWLGLIRTDRTLANMKRAPEWLAASGGEAVTETPEFLGRVIDGLWRDAALMSLSGGTFWTAELGERYGIVDEGGRRPRSRRFKYGAPPFGPADELDPVRSFAGGKKK
jgi:NAD(P)-dependent dehydrogenase (short-subunit alcohol dehydrogenase family)